MSREGLAVGCGKEDSFIEFRLDRVVGRTMTTHRTPGTAGYSVTEYEVFLEGGFRAAVTKGAYDVVGNYLHSLFPDATEGEVVIR